jgi:hypothetical protein
MPALLAIGLTLSPFAGCQQDQPALAPPGQSVQIQIGQGPAGTSEHIVSDSTGTVSVRTSGDRLEIKIERERETREAVLIRETAKSADQPLEIYRVEKLAPPDPADAASLAWLFRRLDADTKLRLGDREIEHPDRAVIAAALAQLEADPPKIGDVLAQLPKLLRLDSRQRVFVAAAKTPSLPPESFDALLAAQADRGLLWAPAPDDEPAEGSQAEVRYRGLTALAERGDLTAAQADRLAAAIPSIGLDSYEQDLLTRLATTASLKPLLAAAAEISSSQHHYQALSSFAAKRQLAAGEADQIARAAPKIGIDSYEASLLVELAGKASVKAMASAAEGISVSTSRHQVLVTLAKRGDLSPADADVVAAAAPGIGLDSYEQDVLSQLVPRASISAILAAAEQISESNARWKVLEAAAKKANLSREEADRVAAAVPGIGLDSYEQHVLVQLIPRASIQAIVSAANQVSEANSHYKVLGAAAGREKLTPEEADQMAAATPAIGLDSYEKQVLIMLVDRAGMAAIVAAAGQISEANSHYEALHAAAAKKGLKGVEADQIAAAVPKIGVDSYEEAVLVRLANAASMDSLLKAAKQISQANSHHKVLLALAKRPGLMEADADKIAAACHNIGISSYEADVLLALVGKASPKAISAAARHISTQADRLKVLEAIAP